ncbi:MAG: TIGR00266 family protein, partial [Anaerotignum sp.]|nr:TIGR00266 family protein [Anaerotignum sp.]
MKYRLIGSVVPAVEILLENTGESVFTQSGGMTWMTEGVEMSTNTRGGLMKGLGRVFAGESLFMANYTNTKPNSVIAFAAGAPGSIYTVDLSATGPMTCQKGAFLCAQDSVNLKTVLTKKLSAGFFGGEGFILQEISGSGIAFLEIDGDLVERELAPGEVLKVDTGNVVAFDSSMSYEIEMVKGAKNIIFGGEGLFLTKLTGPGKVVLQTQSIAEFALRIAP